jgi:flagellar hook-associated protein 2
MSSTGSISLTGLLGGTAGQIDVTSLISSLMQAASVPQTQLKDRQSDESSIISAYQSLNSKVASLQTAAQAITDPTAWTATAVASSADSVVATSDGTAAAGSLGFDVLQTAKAQVTTIAADANGDVVSNPAVGITIAVAGQPHTVNLTSGSAAAVAAAINAAGTGVRASVINTTSGAVLQLTSAQTGASNGFTATGFDASAQTIVPAQDAKVRVGDPTAGGYTISSASNTFTDAFPGITFSVSAPASGVTLSVSQDPSTLSTKIKSLVDAANAVATQVGNYAGQGGVLQGNLDVNSVGYAIGRAVSQGTTSDGTLSTYGIDMDKNGVISFDEKTFLAAWAKDPAAAQSAISGAFASRLDAAANAAIAPVTGSLTASLTAAQDTYKKLGDEISDWDTRLADQQDQLATKFTAMETALARLQSQQSWLTSMFKQMDGSNSSSSS